MDSYPRCPNDPDAVVDSDGWCSSHQRDCADFGLFLADGRREARVCPTCGHDALTQQQADAQDCPRCGTPTIVLVSQLESMITQWRARELVPRGMDGSTPQKLIEEAREFAEDPGLAEAGDVLIVLLAETMGRDLDGVRAIVRTAVTKMKLNLASDWIENADGSIRRVCRTCRKHVCLHLPNCYSPQE